MSVRQTKKNNLTVYKDHRMDIKPSLRSDILEYGKVWTQSSINKNAPAKSWVATLWDYSDAQFDMLKLWETTRKAIGKETSKEGRPHLQIFVVFIRAYRLTQLQKLLPKAHWAKCACPDHAWNYCLKELDYHIQDDRRQGHRSDVEAYRTMIRTGATDRELCDEMPAEFLKFSRTEKMRNAYIRQRNYWTQCIWVHGPTGNGKTTWHVKNHMNADWMEFDGKYFSSYTFKDLVIFDDVDWSKFTVPLLLGLFNIKPYKIRCLGEFKEWIPHVVIVLDEHPPTRYFGVTVDGSTTLPPNLARRIKVITWEAHQKNFEEALETIESK